MPNRVNTLMLRELTARYAKSDTLIAVGYEGLDVQSTNALRRVIAGKNLRMRMVKNRIAKLAFDELGIRGVERILAGQVAFIEGGDPVAMARTIRDFAREYKQVVFRGAIVERTVLDSEAAKGLADGASKAELQGRVVSAALSGGALLCGALLGPAARMAGALAALAEKGKTEAA
ncbi:MAG: 50S ribosomal protein L10 [Planctomycetota bacterium]